MTLSRQSRLPRQQMEQKEHLYKVLVVGDMGTGKTSLIKRYCSNIFTPHYKSTVSLPHFQIGVDFALKILQFDSDTIVRLQLWDIAGQERFGNMTRVDYFLKRWLLVN
jgi:small GTP-binding protein